MSSDRKLALSIAAAILVLFTAIAVISSGRGESQRSDPARATRAVAPAMSQPEAVPAPAVAPASFTAPEEAPVSAGTPEEAEPFEVEPGVNYLARGVEAYRSGEFDHAAAYLAAEVEARPERPYSHYLLALSLWKDGRAGEAAVAMQRSLELDDTSVKSFVNLSRIENDRGEFESALDAATAAVDLAQDDPSGHFLLGRSFYNLGELDEASAALESSLALDDGNGYVWNLLGLTRLDQGRFEEARDALEKAVERSPEVAYMHNNLGMALERGGFRDEAVLAYQRAVALDPAHARASANLARLDPESTLSVPAAPEEEGIALAQDREGAAEGGTVIP